MAQGVAGPDKAADAGEDDRGGPDGPEFGHVPKLAGERCETDA